MAQGKLKLYYVFITLNYKGHAVCERHPSCAWHNLMEHGSRMNMVEQILIA